MNRKTWPARVHGVARVGHNSATKQQQKYSEYRTL